MFFLKSTFLKNILKVATGTTIAQLIVVLSTPVLTRLYSPEDFGIYGMFISIVVILTNIINFGYEQSIVLPKKLDKSISLTKVSILISTFISIFLLVILIIISFILGSLTKEQLIFIYSVPLFLGVVGISQAYSNFLVRRKQFSILSYSMATRSTSMVISQIFLGLFSYIGVVGLIIGHILGQVFSVYSMFKKKKNQFKFVLKSNVQVDSVKGQLFKYKDFPLFYLPAQLVGAVSLQIPIILLTILYNPFIAGLYLMGHRLLTLPSKVVGQAISMVFYKRLADEKGLNTAVGYKLWKVLIPVATFIFLVIIISAPKVFLVVLGKEWEVAGVYSQWLSLWVLFQFVNTPLLKISPVYNKQRVTLVLQIILLILRVTSLYLGYLYSSPLLSIALFSTISSLHNALTSSLYISWESGKKYGRKTMLINILILILLFTFIIQLG